MAVNNVVHNSNNNTELTPHSSDSFQNAHSGATMDGIPVLSSMSAQFHAERPATD